LETEKNILGLTKALFWDVDPQTVDLQKHASYIIEKVIALGTMEDFKIIKQYYGIPKIKRIIKKLRYMNDRDLNFYSTYFNIPLKDFRCYKLKLLNLTHWEY
jgi:hypothetical protein